VGEQSTTRIFVFFFGLEESDIYFEGTYYYTNGDVLAVAVAVSAVFSKSSEDNLLFDEFFPGEVGGSSVFEGVGATIAMGCFLGGGLEISATLTPPFLICALSNK